MQGQAHDGVFLTIEGVEGVGKSTAVKFIQQYLAQQNQTVVITREPGGTVLAEKIRELLLSPNANEEMAPETELLLMFASRAQHIASLIKPAIAAKKWVVSDRFLDASYAYQGAGRGFDLSRLDMLSHWVVGALKPDATILLDAPPALGLARAKNRGAHDRIEQEKIDFFERVRSGYLARAAEDPTRFHIIDATESLSAVHAKIKAVLDKILLDICSDR